MFACVGITTVDLFNSGIERMPEFGGDEFTVNNLAFCTNPLQLVLGGNGAITAFVLARLGAHATLCSAIGRDQLGNLANGWLDDAGVHVDELIRSTVSATATTTVMTDEALNRVSFHHPGASLVYEPGDLSDAILQRANMLLLSSFTLLPKWRPAGFAAVANAAHGAGVITLLDIGPAIGQVAELTELESLLPAIDFFICNEHEICVCTVQDSLERAMRQVLDAGARCVITKQGAAGATVLTHAGAKPIQIPGFSVAAQFTVGAGDSFNAGFMYAIDQGQSIPEAVRYANAVAAQVVSAARGALGAPSQDEMASFLAEY